MSTTGHENEVVRVSGLKATMRKGGNLGIFNKGTCSTAAATADKEVTVGDGFSLVNDAMILVTFQNAVSAADATLRVNSAVDDQDEPIRKPIRYRGAALASGMVKAGDAVMMRYHTDGSDSANDCWNIIGTLDSDTTYPAGTLQLLVNGVNTDQRVWQAKIIADFVKDNGNNLLELTALSHDYTFKKRDCLFVGGALYRCTADSTTKPPFNFVFDANNSIVVDRINGQDAVVCDSDTLNTGWEKVLDLNDRYYVEKAKEEAMAYAVSQDAALVTKINALTRHTRLTDFDLATLKKAVADQNLEKYGLKVGDEKTINGHTYVIAGLNCMKGSHSYTCTTDHVGLIVIPHTTQAWNASGYTNIGAGSRGGGYANSDLHYYLKNTVLPLVNTDLGASNILGRTELLSSEVENGKVTDFLYEENCKICALSEVQVFGSAVWCHDFDNICNACQQLDVFTHYRFTEIIKDNSIWLRSVYDGSSAIVAYEGGFPSFVVADDYTIYVAALILFH